MSSVRITKNTLSQNLQKLQNMNLNDEWGRICSGELLRISRNIVPFGRIRKGDKKYKPGRLSQSGFFRREGQYWITGYDTKYAMYQHEGMRRDGSRIVRNWSNGRKSKFLENPLKENISTWNKVANQVLMQELKKKL
jgi:hypothetical protein